MIWEGPRTAEQYTEQENQMTPSTFIKVWELSHTGKNNAWLYAGLVQETLLLYAVHCWRHTQGGFNTHAHMQTLSVRMELCINWPSVILGWQAEQRLSSHCLLAVRTKLSCILRGWLIIWLTWIRLANFLTDWLVTDWFIRFLFWFNDVTNFWVSEWIIYWLTAR